MIKINIPEQLRKITDDQSEVSISIGYGLDTEPLHIILSKIDYQCNGFIERLVTNGEINKFVNIFVNEEDVRFLDGLNTELKNGDEVTIIPAIAGG